MPGRRVKVQWGESGHAREVVISQTTDEGGVEVQRVEWDAAGRPRRMVKSEPTQEAGPEERALSTAAELAAIEEEDENGHTILKIKIPRVRGMDGDSDPLVRAAGVSGAIENLEAEVSALVRRARSHGYSWTQIGEALGTSKQAAWERFSEED